MKSFYLALLLLLALIPPTAATPFIWDVPGEYTPVLNVSTIGELLEKTREKYRSVQQVQREFPLDGVQKLMNEVNEAWKIPNKDESTLKDIYRKVMLIQAMLMVSRRVELRGVLIDGDVLPLNTEGIKQLVTKLKAAGFNAIFPETFYRSYTIYPSQVTETHPLFAKRHFDVLKVLVEEAHSQGMKVYPWLWTFRMLSIGRDGGNPILGRLPALEAVSVDGKKVTKDEEDGDFGDESKGFVSPAISSWRYLMAYMLAEIGRRYPVDGFLMDYIRYPNNQTEDRQSYTDFQIEYFKKVGTFPSKNIQPGTSLDIEWHLWREDQVNQMVQALAKAMMKARPQRALGTAVFRNEVHARRTKMQNWRHWSNNNWLDFVAPMLYARTAEELDLWLEWESDGGKRHDILYPILGAQRWSRVAQPLDQIGLLQHRGIPGMTIFAFRKLDDEMLNLLGQGPFRLPAMIPHHDLTLAIQKQLESTEQWLQKVVNARNNEVSAYLSQLRMLQKQVADAAKNTNNFRYANYVSLAETFQQTLGDLRNMSGISPDLMQEIHLHLNYAVQLLEIYKTHHQPSSPYVSPVPPPIAVLPEAKPLPMVEIPYLESAPFIDGAVDDAAWEKAHLIPQFFWSTGAARPWVNTRVKIGYDRSALYLAYLNEEPRIDRVEAQARRNNDEQIFRTDDTIEIFLNPTTNQNAYYYFVLNRLNTQYQRASFDKSWQRSWNSAVRSHSQGWNAEIQIPFATLRIPAPENGGTWQGNLCRRRRQEIVPYHCWSFTFGGVHRTDRFGTLKFLPQPTPSPSPSS